MSWPAIAAAGIGAASSLLGGKQKVENKAQPWQPVADELENRFIPGTIDWEVACTKIIG